MSKLAKTINLLFLVTCIFIAKDSFAEKAFNFTLKDINGASHQLSEYTGKTVVLEWFCPSCPFVKKHYESGNMQKLQDKYTKLGIIWLTVNSSAPGRQGFLTNDEAKDKVKSWDIKATAELVDSDGIVGKTYGAKTTPHMFIIDKDQKIVYKGAIDDDDSVHKDQVENPKNYVSEALDEILSGKPVTISETESYGCGVKYAS